MASYLDDIARTDIRQVGGVARDPVGVQALLRSLARNIGDPASPNKLAAEADAAAPLSRHTVRAYLDAVKSLTAWPAHLRSRSPLLTSPKHHFTDLSLTSMRRFPYEVDALIQADERAAEEVRRQARRREHLLSP